VGDPAELGRAVRSVADGGSVVHPQIVEVLVSSRSQGGSAVDRLTPRERDVMALIAEGYNNATIAEHLVLSDKAVAKHINSIFSKLNLSEATEAHRRVKAVLTWLAG
jgi:DNA-binding NarL/FixJ family response regulator